MSDVRKPPAPADPRVAFVLELAEALHEGGYASTQLEGSLQLVCRRLGLEAQFSASPTMILCSFGPPADLRTTFLRVEPVGTDLSRVRRTHAVMQRVLNGDAGPEAALAELQEASRAGSPYPRSIDVIGFGLTSGAASRIMGGGLRELLVATAIGCLIGVFATTRFRNRAIGHLYEPLASAGAAFVAFAAWGLMGRYSVLTAMVAGIVTLLPGYALTLAVSELARRELSSGTARLAHVFIVFMGMGFGVTAGSAVAFSIFGEIPVVSPIAPAAWTLWPAFFVIALGFMVLLRADPRDAGWIVAGAMVGVVTSQVRLPGMAAYHTAFFGALAVGIAANAFSQVTARPAAIVLVPGLLTLVPGSIGFRALTALLDSEITRGLSLGLEAVIVAMSLVAGVLVATIVLPDRTPGGIPERST